MANTLTGLIPTIYEALDVVSRELIGFIPAVNRDSGIERAARGQQILAFVAPPVVPTDIVPAVVPPNDGDQTFGSYNITIDNAKRVPIRWNGEEQRALNNGGHGFNRMLVDQWAQGFRSLANMIEADVATKARQAASRAYGTPGTTPFGVRDDFTDFSNLHQILDDNGAPRSDRQLVLGTSAVNNLTGRQMILNKANEAGTDRLLRQGILDNVQGFNIHQSAGVQPVAKGSGSSYALGNNPVGGGAGYTKGATSLALATGTGTVLPGDVITIAGDSNKYAVVGVGISGPGTITIGNPGLRVAHASGDAVSLSASFTPNMAFSRSAMLLGTRAPALPIGMNGQPDDMADDRQTVTDPISGISFEIAVYKQYRQIQFEIAIAWGAAAIKQDNIAILQG